MIPSFTDCKGRTWPVVITTGMIRRGIAAGVPLDVYLGPKSDLGDVVGNPLTFGSIMYVLCDAERKGVEPEDFADGFDGKTSQDAAKAFLEAVVLFTQPSVAEEAIPLIGKAMDATAAKVKARMKAAASSSFSFDLEEPPASTPTSTASAS